MSHSTWPWEQIAPFAVNQPSSRPFYKQPIMLREEHHVFFEARTGQSLLEAMDQLEPWLDRNDIRPLEFKHTVTPSGAIELLLTFRTREEASLFEQVFCLVGPPQTEPVAAASAGG